VAADEVTQATRAIGATTRVLLLLIVAVTLAAAGCGRSRPARPSQQPTPPQPLEVKFVWRLGVSPSGEWLTFESVLARGPEAGWSVSWLMPATGGTVRALEFPGIGSVSPVWSPVERAGEELAYIRVEQTSEVRVWAVEEPEPRLTVDFGELWLNQLCWSPDGSRLALLATDPKLRRNDPALIDTDTGKRRFARLQVPAAVSPLFFTATGEHFVFARGRRPQEPGQEPTQYLMQASTTSAEVTELLGIETEVCQLAVPIDGRILLQLLHGGVHTGQMHRKELVIVEPGQEGPVSSLGEGSFASAQSLRKRNGQLELVFERAGDLFIRPLGAGSEEDFLQVTDTPEMESGAVFSPQGDSVFFVRSLTPKVPPTQVVRRNLADGKETVLAVVTPELIRRESPATLQSSESPSLRSTSPTEPSEQ